jgi:potassium/hydrogen antiporter
VTNVESNSVVLLAEHLLKAVALIIISGVVFAKISRILRLPDVVLFILAGVIIGPSLLNLVNINDYPIVNQIILTFGAAYILYDGGREIELKILNKVKLSVGLLATIGVVISAFITGYFAAKILHLDFIYALLLGFVVASTDPSVLVPLFKNMKISNKLKQTIISESAFNDAAGAIATFAVLGVITGGSFSLGGSILTLLKTSIGGIIVGAVAGFITTSLISEKEIGFLKEFPSEMAVATVIGSYVFANHFGFSGFMAVFIVGMVCGNKKMFKCRIPDEYYVTHLRFKEVLTIILRMMIFVLLGTQMDFAILAQYWKGALLTVAVLVFIARPISALICVIVDKKAGWTYKDIIYMMWVRETGVIPAALAGMLVTMNLPNAQVISSVTFMTIIITLTFQASTAALLAKILKLEVEEDNVRELIV